MRLSSKKPCYTSKPISNAEGVVSTVSVQDQQSTSAEEDYKNVWSYYNQPSFGLFITCDDEECHIE